MTDTKRPLRIFLCHSSSDKPTVKELYERLIDDGFDAWFDKEKLIPGQVWEIEISKAVKNSDVVVVCLSSQSITKEGFVQKEIKFAIDAANEKPEGTIFIIPARLENCEVPEQIRKYHWADLFLDDGYEWLTKALQIRANHLGFIVKRKKKPIKSTIEGHPPVIETPQDTPQKTNEPKKPFLPRKTWYRFFVEHWFVSAFVSTIPAWWFIFVEMFGESFGLIEDGKLTPTTLRVLLLLFFISFLITLQKALADRYNEKARKATQSFLTIMLESVNAIKSAKLRRFREYINTHHGQQSSNPFFEAIQPHAQIENVLINMQIALSQITGIKRDDISLSLVYTTDKNPIWRRLFTVNIEPDELKESITNTNSSVKQIIDGKVDFIFFPDKNVGVQRNQYISGKKDLLYGGIGSALCKNISLENNEKSIQAVLSIVTYGFQLCLTNDYDAVHNITNVILPTFERRIQLELALLYIKEIMSMPKNETKNLATPKLSERKTNNSNNRA